VLEAWQLPIDVGAYLDVRPPRRTQALLALIDARVSLRLPAPYLVGAAYMPVCVSRDRRALIRLLIGDMLARRAADRRSAQGQARP